MLVPEFLKKRNDEFPARATRYLAGLLGCLLLGQAMAETYSYDQAGRLASVTYMDGSSTAYEYDLNGNLTRSAKVLGPLPPDGAIDTPNADVTIFAGDSVNFTGTGTDPDGALPLSYRWNFDGAAPDSNLEDPGDVTFSAVGGYTVEFFVTDASNLTDPTPARRLITVQNAPVSQPPDGQIDTPAGNVSIDVGQSVNFTATGSDPDAELPLAYRWTFGGAVADSNVEDPGNIAFPTAGSFTVTLFVTDAAGLTDATPPTRVITVRNVATGGGSGSNSNGGGSSGWLMLCVLAIVALARANRAWLALVAVLILPLQTLHAQQWVVVDSGVTVGLNDVWGSASNDVFVVGDGGTILHFDGSAWTPMASGTTESLTAIFGYGPNDIYAVGNNLTMLRYDGTTWAPFAGPSGATGNYADVWTAGPGERLWVLAANRAWYWDGALWTVRSFSSSLNATLTPNAAMQGIGGTATSVITASRPTIGTSQVDGGLFANFRNIGTYDTSAVFAASETDMFVAGLQSRRFQGNNIRTTSQWRSISIMNQALDIWGTSAANVYAVGIGSFLPQGRISHYDGNATDTWTTVLDRPFDVLRSIWGFGVLDAFVVGDNGVILRLVQVQPPQTAANFPASGWLSDFVNGHTGELVLNQYDISLDSCRPLEFGRHYASAITPPGQGSTSALGPNWRHTYQWEFDSNGTTATVTTPQGRVVDFTRVAMSWTADDPLESDLVLIDDTLANRSVVLDTTTDLFYGFGNTSGRLDVIDDRAGNRLRLSYDSATGNLLSITDLQKSLIFGYQSGLLVSVTSGSGINTVTYTYGYQNGHLNTVTDPMGAVTTFNYQSAVDDSYITSITLPEGNVPYRWAYAVDGRVDSQTDAFNNQWSVAYQSATTPASMRAPDNSELRISHDNAGQVVALINGENERVDIAYNSSGKVTSLTTPDGRTTTYSYDPNSGHRSGQTNAKGRSVSSSQIIVQTILGQTFYDVDTITQADGNTIRYEYDGNGLRTAMIDQANRRWEYEYDTNGHMTATVTPNGGRHIMERNAGCQIDAIEDPDGYRTQYTLDPLNRQVAVFYPNGANDLTTYDANSKVIARRSPNGDVSSFTYDLNGNVATISTPGAAAIGINYDAMDRRIQMRSPRGDFVDIAYDTLGRVVGVSGAEGGSKTVTYDGADRAKSFSNGGRTPLVMEYTAMGAPDRLIAPSGEVMNFDRSPASDGNIDTYDNGIGGARKVRDMNGRLAGVENSAGENIIGTVFDELGRPIEISMYNNLLTTQIDYDANDKPIRITDPNGGIWQRLWSAGGRLVSDTDPLGRETLIAHDNLGMPGGITFPGALGNLTIVRDAMGHESAHNYSDGVSLQFAYDGQGRMISGNGIDMAFNDNGSMSQSNGLLIGYDREDRLTTIEVAPGRVVTYNYDDRGLLTSVVDWTGQAMSFNVDEAGALQSIGRANGIGTTLAYDMNGRLSDIVEAGLLNISIAFDGKGRPESSTRQVPQAALISNPGVRNYTHDDASQVEQFTHDALGRRTGDADRNYTWNLAGRVTSYIENGNSVTFDYDATGFMISRSDASGTTDYVWNLALDLPAPTVEREGGSDQRYYVYTPTGDLLYSIAPGGSRLFYHYDDHGNTMYLSDDSGAVVQSYAYSPYGEVLAEQGSVDNPFTFMGQRGVMREGSSDMYYARARFYDAPTARFLSRDANSSIMPKRVNPYQYAQGSPLIYRDATGLDDSEESWGDYLWRKAKSAGKDFTTGALAIAGFAEQHWSKIAKDGADTIDDIARQTYAAMAKNHSLRKLLQQRGKLGIFHNVTLGSENSRLLNALHGTRTALARSELFAKVLKVSGPVVSALSAGFTEKTSQYTTLRSTAVASSIATAGLAGTVAVTPPFSLVVAVSEAIDIPFEFAFRKITGLDGVRLGLHEVMFTPIRLGAAIVDDAVSGRRFSSTGSSLNRAVDQFSRAEDNVGIISYGLANIVPEGVFMAETYENIGRGIYKGSQIVGEGIDEGLGLSDKLGELLVFFGY